MVLKGVTCYNYFLASTSWVQWTVKVPHLVLCESMTALGLMRVGFDKLALQILALTLY